MTQPPMKCAVIGMSIISPTLFSGNPPILAAIRRMVSLAAGIHAGFGAPCPCSEVSLIRPNRVRRAHRDRVVQRLHGEPDHRPFGPVVDAGVKRYELPRMARHVSKPLHTARQPPASVGHQRAEQPHRVRALAVTDGLDVGVLIRVDG